jgi:hypothetical protein
VPSSAVEPPRRSTANVILVIVLAPTEDPRFSPVSISLAPHFVLGATCHRATL